MPQALPPSIKLSSSLNGASHSSVDSITSLDKPNTSLVQKLILVALLAILGCLVVIIAQNSARKPADESLALPEAESTPEADSTTPLTAPQEPIVSSVAVVPTEAAPSGAPEQRPNDVVLVAQRQALYQDVALAIDARRSVQPQVAPLPRPNFDAPVATARRRLPGSGLTLSGRITLAGKPPPERPISLHGPCRELYPQPPPTRHYLVSSKGGLANVVVYVQTGLENYSFAPPKEPVTIDATACFFEPYVSVAQVGQKIRFQNQDGFLHNVHCTAHQNREFNLSLAMQGQAAERTFDYPELFIRFKEDIYEWMFAYVTVLNHPFFAVSDQDGNYKLPPGLPPGTYTLAASHLKAGETVQRISVGPERINPVDFTLQVPTHLGQQ